MYACIYVYTDTHTTYAPVCIYRMYVSTWFDSCFVSLETIPDLY